MDRARVSLVASCLITIVGCASFWPRTCATFRIMSPTTSQPVGIDAARETPDPRSSAYTPGPWCMAMANGSFVALSSAKAALNHLRTADSYAVDVSSLDPRMIVQFAASVFWRTSVSSPVPSMSLGI